MTRRDNGIMFLSAVNGFCWLIIMWFATRQIILAVVVFLLAFAAAVWVLNYVYSDD